MARLDPPGAGSITGRDKDPPDFVQRGKVLIVRRQFQEAVKVCRLGLLAHPTWVEGRLVLAMALMALGRYDEVLAEMRVAMELDPDNGMGHLLRGEALFHKGDYHQAYDAVWRAQELDPLNDKAEKLLAEIEGYVDPDASNPDRPHTSTKVYPAPAARRLPGPPATALSGVSGVSSVSSVSSLSSVSPDDARYPRWDETDDEPTEVGDVEEAGEEAAPDAGLRVMNEEDLSVDEDDDPYTTAPWLPPSRLQRRRTGWEEETLTEDPGVHQASFGLPSAEPVDDTDLMRRGPSPDETGAQADRGLSAPDDVEDGARAVLRGVWRESESQAFPAFVESTDEPTARAEQQPSPELLHDASLETAVNFDAPPPETLFGEREEDRAQEEPEEDGAPPIAARESQPHFAVADDSDDDTTADEAPPGSASLGRWDFGLPRQPEDPTAAVDVGGDAPRSPTKGTAEISGRLPEHSVPELSQVEYDSQVEAELLDSAALWRSSSFDDLPDLPGIEDSDGVAEHDLGELEEDPTPVTGPEGPGGEDLPSLEDELSEQLREAPGPQELSADALELVPEMPPVPVDADADDGTPPQPPQGVASAPGPAEGGSDSLSLEIIGAVGGTDSLETRVNFDGPGDEAGAEVALDAPPPVAEEPALDFVPAVQPVDSREHTEYRDGPRPDPEAIGGRHDYGDDAELHPDAVGYPDHAGYPEVPPEYRGEGAYPGELPEQRGYPDERLEYPADAAYPDEQLPYDDGGYPPEEWDYPDAAGGHGGENAFPPAIAVPSEPDSDEMVLEPVDRSADYFNSAPQRTAALGADEGRVKPYVEPQTSETSPGGPRGLKARAGSAQLHEEMTGKALLRERPAPRRARAKREQGKPERTSWVVLMLGNQGRQRWTRIAFVAGMILLALVGGFLFRAYRISNQVDRKAEDAMRLLKLGNYGDFQRAAQKFADIAGSKPEVRWAVVARAWLNAAIIFEFGDGEPKSLPAITPDADDVRNTAFGVYAQLLAGKLEEAEKLVRAGCKAHPKSSSMHYLSGRICLLQGQTEAAVSDLKKAVALRPDNALYQCWLGTAQARHGDRVAAHQSFAAALAVNEDHVATLLAKVRLLLQEQRRREAASLLDELTKGKHAKAASRGQSGWARLLLARLLLERGEVDDAWREARRARQRAPVVDPEFWDQLALFNANTFKLKKAAEYARQSAKMMRGRPQPHVLKARIFLLQGRAAAALAALEDSSSRDVSRLGVDGDVLRARILLKLGRIDDARKVVEVLRKSSSSVEVQTVAAQVLGHSKPGAAADKLRRLLRQRPTSVELLRALGEVLMRQERYKEAEDQFLAALQNNRMALSARLRLADVYLAQGDFQRAYELVLKQCEDNPWYVPGLKKQAELDLGRYELAEAKKCLNTVLKLVPDDTEARLMLAKVLTMQRDFDAAHKELSEARKRQASGAQLALARGRLALAREQADAAVPYLKEARELKNTPEPMLLLVGAYVFNAARNPDPRATQVVEAMRGRFRGLPETHEAQGRIDLAVPNAARATDAFKEAVGALRHHPRPPATRARILVFLGRAAAEGDNSRKAQEHFEAAVKICPKCPRAHFHLALALDQNRRPKEAIKELEEAIKLAPKLRDAYNELAKLLETDQPRRAKRMYKKYISLNPPPELLRNAQDALRNLEGR